MNAGISVEGIAPEWAAKEVDKSNRLIRAHMLEEQGDVDTALSLYAQVAEMEEQIAEYSRSIGLQEKSWYDILSAAGCWAKAGDLYRALQHYESLLNDPTLSPQMRKVVHEFADKLRERRRQWIAFQRHLQNPNEQNEVEPTRPTPAVSVK